MSLYFASGAVIGSLSTVSLIVTGLITLAIGYALGKIYNGQKAKNSMELDDAYILRLERTIKDMQERDEEQAKQIKELQNKVSTLQTIPLKQIERSIKMLADGQKQMTSILAKFEEKFENADSKS